MELKDTKVVFVLGGPGSGKGTQCDRIVKEYGFTHLSTGDLLRAEKESGSELGEKVKAIMAKGELVNLVTVLQLLKQAMKREAAKGCKGFLIDGYPREIEQGLRFEKEVSGVECVLCFDVADETMKKRMLKRSETSGRDDDKNEETVKARIKSFHQHTEPVIDHYNMQNKVHKINAEGTIEDIFGKVQACLDKYIK